MFDYRQKPVFHEVDFYYSKCKRLFKSKSALSLHKKRETDVTKKASAKRKQKTMQPTINDMFRQHASTRNVENDNQDESWGSSNCFIDKSSTALISWVGCESCGLWYHSICVGLESKNQTEIRKIEYICDKCNQTYSL